MELNRFTAQISILISTITIASAWQCKTLNCLIYPLSLKLWKDQIEVSTRTLRVKAGSSFSITCDGSCVGSYEDPLLRWYGPDRHWIAYEGSSNRVHVEQSFSRRFLKLHILKIAAGDQGEYICRGWLGSERGWDTKSIRLIVDQTYAPPLDLHEATVDLTSRTPSVTVSTSAAVTTATEASLTTEQACLPPKFKCGTGICLDTHQVCDSIPDCEDASDESNCVTAVCTEDMVACTNEDGCVATSQICDGLAQCKDGSDEDPAVCIFK